MKIWKAQKKPIVVGLRLEDRENHLLQSAISWAAALGSPVELVHCLESPIGYSSAGEIHPKAVNQNPALPTALREERARTQLTALGRSVQGAVDVHVRVEQGEPVELLARVARETVAGLIVCGLDDQRPARAFQGVSTALSLAFYAPIPVLILPLSEPLDFEKPRGILINDSLGGEGWHVLESALQLARALNCEAIHHAHILKAKAWDMENTAQELAQSAQEGPLAHEGPLTPDQLRQALQEKIKDELFYRFHNTSCCKDLTSRYHPVAGIGDIDSEVNLILKNHALRFVIMGRHQFHGNRRLALDHIPYHAMLERKAAMLVIPDEWESRSNADRNLSQVPQRVDATNARPGE